MARYGLEELLNDLETIIKANLNTKIASINTEYDDDYNLETVRDEAYFLQTLDQQFSNYPTSILYGVTNIDSISNAGNSVDTFTIEINIVITDTGQNVNIAKKLYRYSRVLKEIIEEKWASANNGIKLNIKSLIPIYFEDANNSSFYRAIGIELVASIA